MPAALYEDARGECNAQRSGTLTEDYVAGMTNADSGFNKPADSYRQATTV